MKLDLSKAYDRTKWLYIRLMILHVDFNLSFVKWIMVCLTSISFAIQIDQSPSTFFRPTRGLRQGFSLSPYCSYLWKKAREKPS